MDAPYFTWNLKKWREDNGLTGEVVEAYKNAAGFQWIVMSFAYLVIGIIVGYYFG